MKQILATIIDPALRILPPMMTSDAAKAMLLAIGMQESRLTHRKQIVGPAMGLWQFERGGGVALPPHMRFLVAPLEVGLRV